MSTHGLSIAANSDGHSSHFKHNKLQRSQSLNVIQNKSCENGDIKQLTDELKKTKEKLNKPCEMCYNYEMQLQLMQKKESDLMRQLNESEKIIKCRKDDLRREEAFRAELEEKFAEEAKQIDKQMNEFKKRSSTVMNELNEIRNLLSSYYTEASEKITSLTNNKEELSKEYQKLFAENEFLLGKHIAKSEQLQAEIIDLPQKMEDMQFYCLKLREDLITALVAKERNEETFRSEILFLKEQHVSDQTSKETLLQSLTQDNDILRSSLDSLRIKHNKMKEKIEDQEKRLARSKVIFQENQQQILKLQHELSELTNFKLKGDEENSSLRNKVQSLQTDLDNSEQVQKDFVKLSQSLQIQLEKIRQADTEVRWQHDEDIHECNSCKKTFHSKKEKQHCSHCGKIFCSECNSYVIYGGPKQRCFKVCNVCHTLLDRETAPYFSNEPPPSPS